MRNVYLALSGKNTPISRSPGATATRNKETNFSTLSSMSGRITTPLLGLVTNHQYRSPLSTGTIDAIASSSTSSSIPTQPIMLLLKRSSNAKHTRNGMDLVRQWNDKFFKQILNALQLEFRQYSVRTLLDKDVNLMNCQACQVTLISQSVVMIGVHGAGLANMIYMPHNSAVVELCPYVNDGRCLLGGGPFSRTAAVLSHNYMIHHPPYDEFQWNHIERTSEFNISRFVLHIKSFLISIGKLP